MPSVRANSRLIIAFCSLSFFFFSACRVIGGGNSDVVATQPRPTTGGKIITFENGRIRCGYKSSSSPEKFMVVCHAMIVEDSGSEALAEEIAQGLTLTWKDPTFL